MNDVVICDALRTPVGDYGGALATLAPEELAGRVIAALLERAALSAEAVDDVILGHCGASGESPCVARQAVLWAGLPIETTGFQLDRRCGSGLQAVCLAAALITSGVAELIVAGGVESMSQAEHYALGLRHRGRRGEIVFRDRLERSRQMQGSSRYPIQGGMIETAENLRKRYGISRKEQDAYTLQSHRRAIAAWASGTYESSIHRLLVETRDGEHIVERDERPRADMSAETLAAARALRRHIEPDATVTARNAAGESDGAAICIVTSRSVATLYGLRPRATLRSWAVAGVSPDVMGLGPLPATRKALRHADLDLGDIGLIELNEAFAVQVLACLREWNLDPNTEIINPNGGALAIGHPLGATGARILTDLLDEMERRDVQFALETMCIGGGQGMAAILERTT